MPPICPGRRRGVRDRIYRVSLTAGGGVVHEQRPAPAGLRRGAGITHLGVLIGAGRNSLDVGGRPTMLVVKHANIDWGIALEIPSVAQQNPDGRALGYSINVQGFADIGSFVLLNNWCGGGFRLDGAGTAREGKKCADAEYFG
jgi:hypothetical protein